jgi:multidrug efflux pump subunit AcrA (membrane-fusion protein)
LLCDPRLKEPVAKRNERPWLIIILGVLCIGAIVIAYTTVGQASQGAAESTRTATVAKGVVQSTVSGSGNLQSASQLDLGFKTSGVVTHIYVTQGQHVTEGELLATLNPESAEVTLAQAKASLQSAEANLSQEEESDGETSTGQSSSTGSVVQASTASVHSESVALTASTRVTTPQATTPASTPTTTTTTTPTTTTPTSTTTTTTPSTTTTTPATPTTTSTPTQTSTSTSKSPAKTTPSAGASKESEQQSGSSSSAKSTVSSATREANLASAKAAVKSDRLTVQSDEQAVQDTKLYAPQDGTIVSLSGEVGETASASGTTKASSSSSSSSSSSTGTGASALGGSSTGSSSSSTDSSSSSSFAVLSNLSSMQLVVALSESEVGNVHVGQIATVTVEALSGAKLAAHVSEVATLSTSSSGAVSYDVTFQLEQLASGLKPGMSATAEVVVKQAEGINVPTSAITADSVTVERGGKQVSQAVTTGLAGNSSTIVLSGLKAGETVVLPTASTSSSTSLASKLGGLSTSGGLGSGGGFPTGGTGGGGFPGGGGAP